MNKLEILQHVVGRNTIIRPHNDRFIVAYAFPADVLEKAEEWRGTLQEISLGGFSVQAVIERCAEVAQEIERRGDLIVSRMSESDTRYLHPYEARSNILRHREWASLEAYDAWRCVVQMSEEALDWPECVNFPQEIKSLFQCRTPLTNREQFLLVEAFGNENSYLPYGEYYVQNLWDFTPHLTEEWHEEDYLFPRHFPPVRIYRSVTQTPAQLLKRVQNQLTSPVEAGGQG